jgi:protein O-GlcNAcase/histone acetyltransferase
MLPKHDSITIEDLCLLCDMFYLPYQHGSRAVELLQELSWLVNYNPESKEEENDSTLPTEWTRKVKVRF